jgi:hypothetical protein
MVSSFGLLGCLLPHWIVGVLGPIEVGQSVVDRVHGNAVFDRADMRAEIAAYAFFLDHLVFASAILDQRGNRLV